MRQRQPYLYEFQASLKRLFDRPIIPIIVQSREVLHTYVTQVDSYKYMYSSDTYYRITNNF